MEIEAARLAKQLFEVALGLEPATRAAFLDRACSGQPRLRREVDSLLAEDRLADGFLSGPALRWAAARSDLARNGARVGPYRILEQIGGGGMAAVFLAERTDCEPRVRVAIKVMRDRLDTPEMRTRFDSERRILATFEHPNIARLLDGGSTPDGVPYVVMELVSGLPITEYCDRRESSLRERLEMFQRVCAAVHYAHQHLVVHRDLKPSNVLIDEEGAPKLLDFGIAKILDPSDATEEATATERRILTPRYASPEHILGERITIASDIYSLGVLLYELLTGCLPYSQRGRTLAELAGEIRAEQAPKPSRAVLEGPDSRPSEEGGRRSHVGPARSSTREALARQLKGDLDTIVLRCLRADPALRYPSVHELSEDLSRYRSGRPIEARRPSAGYLLSKFVLRHRFAVLNAGLALLLIVTAAVVAGVESRRAAAERDVARAERAAAEKERNRADAISRLLVESFEASDPYQVRNADMTAREVLERGAERIDRRLASQPETRAAMLYTIGRVYGRLGVFDRAEELVGEAVELQRAGGGSDRLELARSLRELANVKSELGDLAAAERLVQEAVEIERQELATPSPELADSLRLRAELAARRGELELALRLADEALEIERQSGQDPERMARSLNALTKIRLWAGDLEGAESSGREAIELARAVYDRGDPMLTSYLNHLAVALWRRGHPDEAEPLFVEALRTMRQTLGDRHPAVASPLNNLANLLQSVGRHEEAEALLREALEILRQGPGARHPNVAQVLANLGVAVQARGRLGEAESLIRQSWSMNRELLGEEHGSSLQSADLLTRVLIERGAFEEARLIQRAILETRRSLFGEQSEHAATSLLFLAYAWHKQGALSEAEDLYRQARASAVASLGAEHWLVARIEVDLAEVVASDGRLAEGLTLAERAVAVLEEAFPAGHPERWRAAYAASIFAELRMRRGDGDVESLLVDSLRTLRDLRGESALATLEAEQRLARFRAAGSQ